MTEAAS